MGPFSSRCARAASGNAAAAPPNCVMKSRRRVNHENINRSRLRVDTRKWMAGKLAPKKYGDRILTEQQQLDAQGNPITPSFIVNVGPYPESPPAPEAAAGAKDTRH